jgi:CBS domain-containing protein
MSGDVRTVDESTPIEQAMATMGDSGCRRLVVTGREGKLAGILSIDDVMELLVEESRSIGKLLREAVPSFNVSA